LAEDSDNQLFDGACIGTVGIDKVRKISSQDIVIATKGCFAELEDGRPVYVEHQQYHDSTDLNE
jgi:hypothetical protein